jgi:outer membrane lipoprotein LolB
MRTPLLLLGLALLMAGCSSAPPRPQPADTQAAWQQHRQQLSALHNWRITGRLGIQTGHEGWHAGLDWQQHNGDYTIRITAPLGQGSLLLQGDTAGVTLQTSDGETLRDEDPGLLLYRQLGWKVPVASLRYWVLGLPAPGVAVETLDAYGRLSHLQQSGWVIEFLDYEERQGIELPGRVFVSNHQAKVRLVIGGWQLAAETGDEEG